MRARMNELAYELGRDQRGRSSFRKELRPLSAFPSEKIRCIVRRLVPHSPDNSRRLFSDPGMSMTCKAKRLARSSRGIGTINGMGLSLFN